MTFVYLASFIGGLLLAVRVMIYGVERPQEENPSGKRSFRVSPAMVAAWTVVFGATGYVLTRWRTVGGVGSFMIAAVVGSIVAFGTARLVKQWWTTAPASDVDDGRYVLQGHIARVTKAIQADVEGEVAYEIGNRRHVLRARSFDDSALPAGTDVVIERIEGDVAYVEAWMEVEKRL